VATGVDRIKRRPERVLICVGERHIVRAFRANLERRGYVVAWAFDGDGAIELMESAWVLGFPSFDTVILDAEMPKAEGYEVLEWIRTHGRTREAWVAMMIPRGQGLALWEQRRYRADVYVAKSSNQGDYFR